MISDDPTNFALSNYDIGHVLHGDPNGAGVSYLNSVCQNSNLSVSPSPRKAGSWSNSSPNYFSTFIHEVGHQFSARHTFNSISGTCNGNITTTNAYEPGSGSTYMAYWGSCYPDNISGTINYTYFHSNSIERIINYSRDIGTCSINTPSGNTPPVVVANPNSKNLIIPKGTPFVLEGSGTDGDGHTILYNWEQYNLGSTRGGADDAQNSTDSPIFRSVAPSATGNIRMFPALSTILGGSLPNNDEALPQVARTITMRLTGRDNNATGGGIHCASADITVTDSAPFKISSFNTNSVWQYNGSGTDKVLLTWDVSNTNQAPINCTDVKITFSIDGGLTFPITILASTPNDGSELINVPSSLTTIGRIKIEAIGNIFFDINDRNITISNICLKETVSIIKPDAIVSELVGSDALNLSSTPYFGLVFPISVPLSTADPSTKLIANNINNSSCAGFAERPKYKKYEFGVTAAGNYIFTFTGSTIARPVMNLYQNSFNSDEPCTNWLMSSLTYDNGSVTAGSTMTYNLTPNVTYILVVSGYNNNDEGTCTVTCTNSAGGEARNFEPKTSFKYLVVNNENKIVGFFDNTNLKSFPAGQYKLYIFSYIDNTILSDYVNTNFTTFQNLINNNTLCGSLSSNYRQVNIYQPILYVKQGGTGTGTSWADASGDLQAMIETNLVQQVWVAGGRYKPTTDADRTKSFKMKAGVKIYGGFPATGNPVFADRDWNMNKTYLSGDLLGNDIVTGFGSTLSITNNSENSYKVVSNNDNGLTIANSLLDGFIITGGNANGNLPNDRGAGMYNNNSSPNLANLIFSENSAIYGGGNCNNNSSPNISNVIFLSNTANYGGGISNILSSPQINNSVFLKNRGFLGGGLNNDLSSAPNINNVTFAGNYAAQGGGVYIQNLSSTKVTNSIFWGNTAASGADIWLSGTISINNTMLQSSQNQYTTGYTLGAGMLYGANPLFIDAANNNLTLQAQSCAINAGNNTDVPMGSTTDLAANPRIYSNGIVDMGAYEFQGTKQTPVSPTITSNNALNFDGTNDFVSLSTLDLANCTEAPVTFSDALTIEYWFKGTNPQSAVRFQNGQNYIVAGWGSGTFKHILSNDGGINGVAVGTAATDGNWHHVAMTWQRNTVNGFKSYLDGVLVEQRQSSNTVLPSFSSGMFLGAFDGSSEFLNGALDEVRVWNIARSQSDIQQGMVCGVSAPQTGLLMYYKFDHGTTNGSNAGLNRLLNSANPSIYTGTLSNFNLTSTSSNWVKGKDCGITLSAKVFLEGAYNTTTHKMRDDLRVANLIPTTEPYTALNNSSTNNFLHVGGGGNELTTPSVLAVTGNNAIVDWVFIELRSATDPTNVLYTRSALLQADGDVVDMDGTLPVLFTNVSAGNYFISFKHRNHLKFRTQSTFALTGGFNTLNFSNNSIPLIGTNPLILLETVATVPVYAMYSGDLNANGSIDATDRSDAWNSRNLTGYNINDCSLNGTVDATDRSNTWNNRNITTSFQ